MRVFTNSGSSHSLNSVIVLNKTVHTPTNEHVTNEHVTRVSETARSPSIAVSVRSPSISSVNGGACQRQSANSKWTKAAWILGITAGQMNVSTSLRYRRLHHYLTIAFELLVIFLLAFIERKKILYPCRPIVTCRYNGNNVNTPSVSRKQDLNSKIFLII